jgi:hypothetical protein
LRLLLTVFPMKCGRNLNEPDNFIYFQKYAITEHRTT